MFNLLQKNQLSARQTVNLIIILQGLQELLGASIEDRRPDLTPSEHEILSEAIEETFKETISDFSKVDY